MMAFLASNLAKVNQCIYEKYLSSETINVALLENDFCNFLRDSNDAGIVYGATMKLPNAQDAVIDMDKLSNYCLSQTHPRGRNKARVFATVLGFTTADAESLRDAILAAILVEEAVAGDEDKYGSRYHVDFEMQGLTKIVSVRCSWIIRAGEDFPRLTSCYIL